MDSSAQTLWLQHFVANRGGPDECWAGRSGRSGAAAGRAFARGFTASYLARPAEEIIRDAKREIRMATRIADRDGSWVSRRRQLVGKVRHHSRTLLRSR